MKNSLQNEVFVLDLLGVDRRLAGAYSQLTDDFSAFLMQFMNI